MTTDIAIVGVSVEVPEAADIRGFWDIIRSGRTLVRPFPAARRKGLEEYVSYLRHTSVEPILDTGVDFHDGCFLDEIADFDYAFFGMNPKQASVADPHQRMLMRTMLLALEDAGWVGDRIRGSRTGVYVGFATNPGSTYMDYVCRIDPGISQVALTGNIPTMLANRLSHFLDLRGPSLVIDSACSASLVAVHQAKNALLAGDCDLAVVAGARIVFAPVRHPHSAIGIESSDGFTRTFDAAADGTGFGEGSGAVVLKRLDEAVADGDRIYATIRGSAVNHDGRTEGLTNPDSDSQAALLDAAWRNAQVDPRAVGYIEAHGTATRVGDPIEFEGLRRAFGWHTSDERFCAIGTVKANIGHLFEGSGVLGLIKTVLQIRAGMIAPQANFHNPNPAIDFETGPLYVPTALVTWPERNGPRLAGVSAFGLGGTNAHVVVAEHRPAPSPPPAARRADRPEPSLFTLSAASHSALTALRHRYVAFIDQGGLAGAAIGDVCYTSNVSRGGYRHRLALVVGDVDDLRRQLAGEPATAQPGPTLSAAMQSYLDGGEVDWPALHPTGPRIVDLPGYAFEEHRCWMEFPDSWRSYRPTSAPPRPQPLTHTVRFVPVQPPADAQIPTTARVLALVDEGGDAERTLDAAGVDARFLRFGPPDGSSERWDASDPAAFDRIADLVERDRITHIVHALAFEGDPAADVTDLDHRVEKNLFSLFLLAKALMVAGVRASLAILTRRAIATVPGQPAIGENSALAGLAKGIAREYPYLRTKVIDVDEAVAPRLIAAELHIPEYGLFALRGSERLREVFDELPELSERLLESAEEHPFSYLKPGGTYLITGGTGGIGLEVAKAFAAARPDITLVLSSRSGLPPREQWPSLLAAEPDGRLAEQVRALAEIERLGTRVQVQRCDAGESEDVIALMTELRGTWGRVDGIVHAAGVPGGNSIMFRTLPDFAQVVAPKLRGAYLIDRLTREDRPDFIVYFSSVAVVFPAPGQGDYAAANYYLDTIAQANSDPACRVLAIDWVAWKETGMAVTYGTNDDTTFKSIPTELGLRILDSGLRSEHPRIFAGEMHYSGDLVHILPTYDIALSPEITEKVGEAVAAMEGKLRQQAERVRRAVEAVQVSLTGREDGDYTELEQVVARCLGYAVGYETIDVRADFFDLGGDSIMAASVAASVRACLSVEYDVADLLADRTVEDIAATVESMVGMSGPVSVS